MYARCAVCHLELLYRFHGDILQKTRLTSRYQKSYDLKYHELVYSHCDMYVNSGDELDIAQVAARSGMT
jgi:hypothetical protein